MADKRKDSITIKKYANRRLYNTATSTYVTLEDLARMIKDGVEFNVYDAKTGEEITRSVLTQIIMEAENSGGGLLPLALLRQLAGFYGGNALAPLLGQYLEQSMTTFTGNQEKMRELLAQMTGQVTGQVKGTVFPLQALEDLGKQNMALFEQALKMFTPRGGQKSMQEMQEQMSLFQKQFTQMMTGGRK